jgi:SNF2 family DNA or RNA helicase
VTTLPDSAQLSRILKREAELAEVGGDVSLPDPANASPSDLCGPLGTAREDCARTFPPREHGGNMDIRFLKAGGTVYLPCYVDGCGLGLGDPHYAQGDGEVSGTAIETDATFTLRTEIIRQKGLRRGPHYEGQAALLGIPSTRFYATTGFPVKSAGETILDLRYLDREGQSSKLENLKNFKELEEAVMPAKFRGKLRPYQKAGFNWLQFLNQYNFGGCLADDMGLGKTVQTLALLQSIKEKNIKHATLLVMPTSLIYNWELEAKRFTPNLKILVYTGTNRNKNVERFQKYDLVLTSYGIVRLDIDILTSFYFNYVILDESQAIKNPSSNISKAVRKLKSKYRLILTGTPLENSTMDLWSQMTFLNPGLLGNQTFFKNEFLTPIEKKKDEAKTYKLNSIIKPFILRRHKSQVAKELPKKVESIKYCSMTSSQEETYEEAKSYFRNKILDEIEKNGIKKSHFLLLQGLTKLRQIANHPRMVNENYTGDSGKLDDVISMISNAISEGHKILIFSQFVKHLSILCEYLDENRIKYAYLDGSTKDRESQVRNFQENDEIRIFMISLKAGGLGLNLTKADYVFLLDPWWNPAVEQQAIDRAHRIGQENKVFTYKFISKNTVEEKILALQKNKLKLATDLITTEENFFKELTADDIKRLFD